MNKKVVRVSILSFGYAILYIPLALVVMFSFNSTRSVYKWEGVSLKWYSALWGNAAILESFLNSLKVATLSATLAMIIGTLCAFGLVRVRQFKGRRLFETLSSMPLIIPEVVTGLSLLLLFVSLQNLLGIEIPYGIPTISVAHTTLGVAYVIVVVRARLLELDLALEEAAMDLGAKPLKVFRDITIPLIAPSCIAGWFLAFALSLDDVVIASFVSSPESTTLPMVIFSTLKTGGVTPKINALATIMLSVSTIGVFIASIIAYRKHDKS